MNKTQVLFAHPFFEHSKSNAKLIQVYQDLEYVKFRDLYEDYPDFNILSLKERKRMVVYDTLIFHFPLMWFAPPPLLTLWIDEVFDMKWITSHREENPLIGKKAHIIVTAGGTESAFSEGGLYRFDAKAYLQGLIKCIRITGMQLGEVLTIYNADNLNYWELEKYKQDIKKILEK